MKYRQMAPIVVVAMVCGLPLGVLAQDAERSGTVSDVERAEAFAAEAYEAYTAGKYTDAITLYLKALDVSPSADILYNLAKIYDLRIRDRELAMRFYRRYVSDPGADPDRVREVNERLAVLRELELAADAPVTASPRVHSSPQGAPSAVGERSGRVQGNDGAGFESAEEGMSTLRVAGLVTAGAGLVGIGIGAAFGLSARSSANEADCNGNQCASLEDVNAIKDASRAADISTVMTIAGVSLAAAGTVLFLAGGSTERQEQPGSATLAIRPVVSPNLLGTHVSASW